MSQIKLSPNANGTGVFTIDAPNSNTNRTFSLPDETGTVLTTESSIPLGKIASPVVKLFGDSGQTTSSSVMTNKTVTFNESHADHIDTHNFFNSTNNRIEPTIAGYYFCSFSMEILTATRSGPVLGGAIGSVGIDFRNDNASFSSLPTTISGLGYFNGTTSYVSFISRSSPASRTIDFATVNFFLIRAD